jgi:hypothetical protein
MAWSSAQLPPTTTTPSSTMQLDDLTKSVPSQAEAIDQLLDNTDYFSTSWRHSSLWVEFRESVWRKGLARLQTQEPFERGDDPIENSQILPDIVPTTRLVANIPSILFRSLGLNGQRVLVRSEYEEAERAALLAFEEKRCSTLAVTGQPGIGVFASRSITAVLNSV